MELKNIIIPGIDGFIFEKVTDELRNYLNSIEIGECKADFDKHVFKDLITESKSLRPLEKARMIENVHKMSQYQVCKIMDILKRERVDDAQLKEKYSDLFRK